MDIERKLIISILKQTRSGAVSHELIKKDAVIPASIAKKLIVKLQKEGLVNLSRIGLETNAIQRMELAIRAISLGTDPERASALLHWQEFEGIGCILLERSGYQVTRSLRFKHAERRWEIDLVGCKQPLVLCIDCKHWQHGLRPSTIKKIVEKQIERVKALAKVLPDSATKIGCVSWHSIKLVPIVLSLITDEPRFHDNVPIVPILRMPDFLDKLPFYVDSMAHYSRFGHDLQNRFLGELQGREQTQDEHHCCGDHEPKRYFHDSLG